MEFGSSWRNRDSRAGKTVVMANEIAHNAITGQTLYAVRWQLNGNVFLSDGASDEVWGTDGRDADDYDVTMTENAPDGHYIGNFDTSANISAGDYPVTVFIQAGGSPADSDLANAQGIMNWDGTAEINASTITEKIDDDVIGDDGDTLESLSDQMDVLSAQGSQVLNVYKET